MSTRCDSPLATEKGKRGLTLAPYRYDPIVNRHIGSIADLIQRQGDIRANAALQAGQAQAQAAVQRGQIWGNAIGSIGQMVGAIPQQIQAQKEQAQVAQMRGLQLEAAQQEAAQRRGQVEDVRAMDQAFSPAAALGPGGQGPMPEGAPRPDRETILKALPGHLQPVAIKHFQEIDDAKKKDRETRNDYWASLAAGVHAFGNDPGAAMLALQDAAEDYPQQAAEMAKLIQANPTPEFIGQLTNSLMVRSPKYAEQLRKSEPKTREVTVTNPDGSTTIQIVKDEPGQTFTSAPKPVEAAPGTFGDYLKRVASEQGKQIGQLAPSEVRRAKEQFEAAGRAPTQGEPLESIMGPNGPILVPRSQAVGKRPASSREQGRPVTAGDASDLADFNTSLDELAAVRAAIAPGDSTGIIARVGATIPYVTQITGWGADAKKRQAVIDRVKQVIGKTLEGGVLRKEDEAKYEKILPNIGDAPEVAAAKLDGLDAAVQKRMGRRLDALADANYDVSKYRVRPTTPPPATPTETKVGGFTVRVKP